MKAPYFPAKPDAKSFNCLHCATYAVQVWRELAGYGGNGFTKFEGWRVAQCTHCSGISLWQGSTLTYPRVVALPAAHEDLPANCTREYEEARKIFSDSPRAAAALLRLCIQKLMPELGEKGKNIYDDIRSLVEKGLPPMVQQALDVCRVIGNEAVHPGEIDLNDTPEIASELFGLVNFIVDDRISRPRQIQALYQRLPEGARAQIERRDGLAKPGEHQ